MSSHSCRKCFIEKTRFWIAELQIILIFFKITLKIISVFLAQWYSEEI